MLLGPACFFDLTKVYPPTYLILAVNRVTSLYLVGPIMTVKMSCITIVNKKSWGEVGKVRTPHLVIPITVEPTKPCMCYGAYFRTKLKSSIHYLKHYSLFNA